MKQILTTNDILTLVRWYSQAIANKSIEELPIKTKWNIKKNIEKIANIANSLEELINDTTKSIRDEYISDEKSVESINENGETVRKIKEEYMEEYTNKITSVNAEIEEILATENEVDFTEIDVEKEIEKLSDDSKFNLSDMEMIEKFMGKKE